MGSVGGAMSASGSATSGAGAGATQPSSFSPFLDTIPYQPSQIPNFGQTQQQDPLQQLLAYISQGGGIG